nr:poly [ADP-ribose] polymerase 2 [Tanacetum cinerariifolium]
MWQNYHTASNFRIQIIVVVASKMIALIPIFIVLLKSIYSDTSIVLEQNPENNNDHKQNTRTGNLEGLSFEFNIYEAVATWEQFSKTKKSMLLWHGSPLSNWTGILSQGLRIAPPEVPVTGYMFGKGVYFADMFSKHANYYCAYQQSSAGVLLLCKHQRGWGDYSKHVRG